MTATGRIMNPQQLHALRDWLQEKLAPMPLIRLPEPTRPGAGASSETLFLNPVVGEENAQRELRLVLRIEPTARRIYMLPSIARQFGVMERLAALGSAPVPVVRWHEPDPAVLGAPFFVMERVEGQIPNDFLHSKGLLADLSPVDREALWLTAVAAMAAVHAAPARQFEFLARPEWGANGLAQEIALWDEYARWSGAPLHAVQARTRLWLEDHKPVQQADGLAWGDARICNMIFRDGRCAAVLDWETVSLAGAESDLGWWMFYDWMMAEGWGVPRLDGIGDGAVLVKAWEGFSGRRAENMEWHEVFATWRFSLISDRARLLMRQRGEADPLPAGLPTPHVRRLEMLIGG
jgi:aminoglycoside phosphotransferase (APT) family kinase protein